MANADHLILAIGVGAILIGITVGAVFYPSQPQTNIQLVMSQESYRLGQVVEVRLENDGPFTLCTPSLFPWKVQRHVDDEWHGVFTIITAPAEGSISPGETVRWGWVAATDPYWEEYGSPANNEVLPGEYRFGVEGWLCGDNGPEPRQDVSFYAYFELV